MRLEGCRFGVLDESGAVGQVFDPAAIAAQCAEFGHECVEAVDGEAAGCDAGGLFGFRGG